MNYDDKEIQQGFFCMATLSSAFGEIYATAQILHAERRNHAQRASPSTCGNTVFTSDLKDRKVVMHHFNNARSAGFAIRRQ